MTPGPATPVAPRKRMTGASRKKTVCFAEHGARTDHRLPGLPEPTGQYYIAHVGRKAGAEASPDLNSTDYAARLELIAVRPLNLPKDYVTSNVVISWRNWHHIDATLGWDGFCPTKHPLGEAFRIGQALSKDKVGEDVSQSLDATLLKSGKSAWKHFYVVCQGRKDASKPGAPGLYLDIVSKVLPDPYKGPDSCARLRAGGPE